MKMRLLRDEDVINAVDKHTDNNGKLDNDITCILEKIPTYREEDGTMMSYGSKVGTFPFTKGELEKMYELTAERIADMKENIDAVNPHDLVHMNELCAKIDSYIWLMENKENAYECDLKE